MESRISSKKPPSQLSIFWSIVIIITLIFTGVTVILLSVLLANLKASGDAFSAIINDMLSTDYPTEIKNGMLGIASLIGKETSSLRSKLDTINYCKNNEYFEDDWPLEGQNIQNNKDNNFVKMNTFNYNNIYKKCDIELASQYGSSTSVISDSLIFFTNPNGYIYCYHLDTCTLIWSQNIAQLLGYNNIIIAPSAVPSLFTNSLGVEGLIFGAIGDRLNIINTTTGLFEPRVALTIPCITIALNKYNGNLLFTIQVGTGSNRDKLCEQRLSYSILNDLAISGLDSSNDYISYNTLTFQGSVHGIDINTGLLTWKTFVLDGPLNGYSGGYSGGGIRGSNPPINQDYNLIYFSNKNLFNYTQSVYECLYENIGQSTNTNDYFLPYHLCLDEAINNGDLLIHDSIFAVNYLTGLIQWSSQRLNQKNGFGIDARTPLCNNGTLYQQDLSSCPVNYPGPGFGYNDQPILHRVSSEWRVTGLSLGGTMYSFNALNGDPRWGQNVAYGSTYGKYGFSFNPELKLFFVTISGTPTIPLQYNGFNHSFVMPLTNGSIIYNSGLIMAIDSLSGDIIWQSVLPYSIIDMCPLITDTTELFKQYLNFTTIDGNPSSPGNLTTGSITLQSCKYYQLNIPMNQQDQIYSKLKANPSLSSHYGSYLLYIPTLYGNVLLLNAFNGQCLGDMACDYGGVFNAASIAFNHIVFSCGDKENNTDPNLINNKTFVYKINI